MSIACTAHHRPSTPTSAPGRLTQTLREIAVLASMLALYRLGRQLVSGQEPVAIANAELIHRVEAWLHFPSEAAIQAWLSFEPLLRAANWYYVGAHFPVTAAFLLWGWFCRPREEYLWARRLLVGLTAAAMVLHVLVPLAPPRMFGAWGFTDTMSVYGPSAYGGASASVANQFAAMPSLHVGWAAVIALVVMRTGPRPAALLAAGHAVTTLAVVVVTANHWWLDAVVAVALLAALAKALPGPAAQEPTASEGRGREGRQRLGAAASEPARDGLVGVTS